MSLQMADNLGFSCANHRSDQVFGSSWQHAQASGAGAPKQPHQYGFRAIRSVMGGGYMCCPRGGGRLPQCLKSGNSGSVLEIASRAEVELGARKRDSQCSRVGFRYVQFVAGRGAEAVIDPVSDNLYSE